MASEAAPGSQSHRMVEVEGTSGGDLVPLPCSSRATESPGCLPCFCGQG